MRASTHDFAETFLVFVYSTIACAVLTGASPPYVRKLGAATPYLHFDVWRFHIGVDRQVPSNSLLVI